MLVSWLFLYSVQVIKELWIKVVLYLRNESKHNKSKNGSDLNIKPWPNGPASSRKWTQVELA